MSTRPDPKRCDDVSGTSSREYKNLTGMHIISNDRDEFDFDTVSIQNVSEKINSVYIYDFDTDTRYWMYVETFRSVVA